MTTLMMLSFTVIMMILSKTQESMADVDVNQVMGEMNQTDIQLGLRSELALPPKTLPSA